MECLSSRRAASEGDRDTDILSVRIWLVEDDSVGQRQSSLLRLQPLQMGFSSLHFFLRRRQVKQPVLLLMMGITRIMRF